MKKFLFIIFGIFVLFNLWVYSIAQDSEWTKLDENNYINLDTVIGATDFYGYSFLLKSYNKGQYESVNNKKIKYSLIQYEINCARKTYKIGIIDSYDAQDNFVYGDYNRYAKFQPIVNGSVADEVEKIICNAQ